MSGIFGFSYISADSAKLNETLDGLSYWNRIYGRDASGSECFDYAGIGCHIEHFSDSFPFGGPILTFRGCPAVVDALLYNRDELTTMLGLPENCSTSDEELLLMLLDEKGFSALSAVNGDFTGAIYDAAASKWTIFRDHMGVRPLYYYLKGDIFAFSTDLRGLLSIPGADKSINEMKHYRNITRIFTMPGLETDFAYIRSIQPGAVCHITETAAGFRMTTTPFWTIRKKKIRFRTDEEYRTELRRLITDSIHRRCDAIPGLLGAELSGGLDSSVIDILIHRYGRDALYYSWSYDPQILPMAEKEDEREVIFDICKQEGIECRFTRTEDRFGLDYMLQNAMPPYLLTTSLAFGSKWMGSQGAKVVFSGHGGDEGVSHRCSRFELLYNREIIPYFKLFWRDTEGLSLRLLRTIHRGIGEAWAKWRSLNTYPPYKEIGPKLMPDAFCTRMERQLVLRPFSFSFSPHQYVQQGGTRTRLAIAAFYGAFNNVRYIFPFVDHRVMDYAVSIPRRLFINNQTSRLIFRETFADLMPESLRAVQYKDMPSARSTDQIAIANDRSRPNMENMLTRLDEQFWADILDFDRIRSFIHKEVNSWEDMVFLSNLKSILIRCIMIENSLHEAEHWRERHD